MSHFQAVTSLFYTVGRYIEAFLIFVVRRFHLKMAILSKIVSEYNQEIPQSQTADYPVAPRGRAAQLSRDTRKTN